MAEKREEHAQKGRGGNFVSYIPRFDRKEGKEFRTLARRWGARERNPQQQLSKREQEKRSSPSPTREGEGVGKGGTIRPFSNKKRQELGESVHQLKRRENERYALLEGKGQ